MKLLIQILLIVAVISITIIVGHFTRGSVLQTHDMTGREITMVVYTYETGDDVSQSYWGSVHDDGVKRNGWAGWSEDGLYCEIHTLDLRHLRDSERERIAGHELFHCVYGSFHPE